MPESKSDIKHQTLPYQCHRPMKNLVLFGIQEPTVLEITPIPVLLGKDMAEHSDKRFLSKPTKSS